MILDRFLLKGQVALVTGASSGLGEYFALILAEAGAKVVVAARRTHRLESLVARISDAGGEASAVALDITNMDSVKTAFDHAESQFGTVNVLVNNAGVAHPKRFLNVDEESWDYVLNTNLKGAWRVASEGSNRMVQASIPGSIINIGSILGLHVGLDQTTYTVSKAGVIQMTRVMALELVRKGIRANALCPGYFASEMNQDYFNSEQGKAYIEKMPAQRLGNIEELAGPLLLLASDAGSFINGVALPVDGGHLVKSL